MSKKPFENVEELIAWQVRNCDYCIKGQPDSKIICDISDALICARSSDMLVSDEIYNRMQFIEPSLKGHCPEIVMFATLKESEGK